MLGSHAVTQRLWRILSRGSLGRATATKRVSSPLEELRALSTSSGERNKPLKQWTLVVNPFSSVRVHLRCSISVSPLDPHSFPAANRALITVNGTRADQGLKLDNFHVQYDERSKELLIVSENVNSNVSVDLSAPIKSDLHITASGEGNVTIQEMESDTCQVVTENGDCDLHAIKSHRVVVRSAGGNVRCTGTIHGNVDISTSGNSTVNIKKIQGTRMNVSTERGALRVKAIYADSTSVSSSSGNITLGSVQESHGLWFISVPAFPDGSSGCLTVSSRDGDVDAYVGQRGSAQLRSQHGSVSVRVPASMRAAVLLYGVSVDVSPEVDLREARRHSTDTHTTVTAFLNGKDEGGQWIKAWAEEGVVTLKSQSWLESLKIESQNSAGQQIG
ncbi:protein FAM185A isoform X1 [Arapaima gigas]